MQVMASRNYKRLIADVCVSSYGVSLVLPFSGLLLAVGS